MIRTAQPPEAYFHRDLIDSTMLKTDSVGGAGLPEAGIQHEGQMAGGREMCFWVIVGTSVDVTEVANEPVPDGCMLRPIKYPSLQAQIPDRVNLWTIVTGDAQTYCSCALWFSADEPSDEPSFAQKRSRHLRTKGRRKGWSEAKIRRAIGDERVQREKEGQWRGLRPDVRAFLGRLAARLEGIFVVMYHFDDDFSSSMPQLPSRSIERTRLESGEIPESVILKVEP